MNKKLPERIFLCGFMGAGKSTIGKELAQEMELPFSDLDVCIEQRAGMSIPDIFKCEKESGFRKHERDALLELIHQHEGVIALGGGTLQNQQLIDHIKSKGLLIFIEVPVPVLISRIRANKKRPLLLDEHGNMKPDDTLEKELQVLYQQRLSFYEQADLCIHNTGHASVREAVQKLMKKIRHHVTVH